MRTNCAPLVADLSLFCYDRDFMKSHGKIRLILLIKFHFRHFDDLLDINNFHFEQMVDRIYPAELQLNEANSSDTEAPFFI